MLTNEELNAHLIAVKRVNDATIKAIRALSDYDLLLLDSVVKASSHVSATSIRAKIADARNKILNPTPPPPPLSAEDNALIDEIFNRLK